MRLDKFLSNKAFGSRKEVHRLIKDGRVTLNGITVFKKDCTVDVDRDTVTVDGVLVSMMQRYYIKCHKPSGCITAVEDSLHPVVMDILPEEFKKMGVVPVGRLDKDTEGLILLTNDGAWGHKVINGRKHIPKIYELLYDGVLSEKGLQHIREGIVLKDGTRCKPADIELTGEGAARIIIEEGKYHQVKRMVAAAGGTVTYLKRISIGSVTLDEIPEPGDYMHLSDSEIKSFKI